MYSSAYLWSSLYGNPAWGGQYYGWVAQWANIDAPSAIPGGWDRSKLLFWQNGIWNDHAWIEPWVGANPDIDNNLYMGTLAELDDLIGYPAPVPEPPDEPTPPEPPMERSMEIKRTQIIAPPGSVYPANTAEIIVPAGETWFLDALAGHANPRPPRLMIALAKAGASPNDFMPLLDLEPNLPNRWHTVQTGIVLSPGDRIQCRAISPVAETTVQLMVACEAFRDAEQ
jgi:hypothetical protein